MNNLCTLYHDHWSRAIRKQAVSSAASCLLHLPPTLLPSKAFFFSIYCPELAQIIPLNSLLHHINMICVALCWIFKPLELIYIVFPYAIRFSHKCFSEVIVLGFFFYLCLNIISGHVHLRIKWTNKTTTKLNLSHFTCRYLHIT